MSDWNWTHISEGIPDGCCDVEVMYEKDRVIQYCCTCDLHWKKANGGEMPDWFRLGSFEGWEEYL